MTRKLVGAWALALASGMAAAQPPERPLSGPPVKQNRPAGLEGQFGEVRGDRRGPIVDRIPFRLYAQAVQKLRGDAAPDGLRLTPEQDGKVTAIEDEFRTAAREFGQKTRGEGGRPARRGGGGNPPEAGASEPMRPDPARVEEMRRNAPKPEDYQVRIFAVLSEPQQKFVETEVAKAREELEKRRADEYMQREIQKRKGAGEPGAASPPGAPQGAPPRPEAPPPGAPGEGRERFRRIFERLQQLPPEERERVLRRLEEELDRQNVDNSGPRRPGRDGQRKPPPPMDDVKVPPPDKKPQ